MKSRRITVSIRGSILDSIEKSWIKSNPPPDIVQKARFEITAQLAKDCWDIAYGNVDLSRVPSDMLHMNCGIKIQKPNGDIDYLEYREKTDKEGWIRINRFATRDSKVEVVLTEKSKEWKRYKASLEERKEKDKILSEYQNKKRSFISQVRQVVESVNTTKQLVEAWPEIEDHLPCEIRDPSNITLPAVSIEGLNNQL